MHSGHGNNSSKTCLDKINNLILGKAIFYFLIFVATKPTCCIFKINDPYSWNTAGLNNTNGVNLNYTN